ncbi:DUF4962 domain-containing protein, partial [Candidatus Sumerlaeota bacterium]|nr:DUF4962 domain-containing protein [Candidatus Sumerlaeota bacterium]
MQERNRWELVSLLRTVTLVLLVFVAAVARGGAPPEVDDSPARPGEWGFRPADAATVETNPPAFAWRPQKGAATYVLECSPAADFSRNVYRAENVWLNVHCPPKSFPSGKYFWRYAFVDGDGKRSQWSKVRTFTIPSNAVEFPMPPISELIARVPKQHPRLFLRPEEIAQLRLEIRGPLRSQWQQLVREANSLLSDPPSLDEPLKYDPDWKRGEPRWLERWWGNRVKTMSVTDGAATLAFVHMLTGEQKYGDAARRFMLAAASWDPAGATSRPYNDEAAMPVLYMLSRAYTWGQGVLS